MGILTYLKVGILVAALGIGASAAWYIQGVRLDKEKAHAAVLTRQLEGYKRAVKILKEDLKTDQETDHEKERIDSLTPEQLPAEFERLRQRSREGRDTDTE